MYNNIICYYWLCVYCIASINEAAFNLTFPDDLQIWCPHTKFCDLEPAERLDPALKDKVPCCGSCSCSHDCGKYRNCCTSSMDRYNIDETLRTVCRSLTVNTNVEEQHLFYIVDKCPNFTASCVDQNASILGSYHPVYSKITNLIYYNIKCAECHNQSEVTLFEAAIQCYAVKESYTNIMFGVMIGKTLDSECTIQFVPPDDIDMRSQVCYLKKKTTCSPESSFYALRDSCASFNATYRAQLGAFGNIYCYLCSSYRFTMEEAEKDVRLNTLCYVDVTRKFWGQHAFTVLINHETVDSLSSAKNHEEHQWCEAANGEPSGAKRCRAIHCPVGQYRTQDGCKVLGDKWFADTISINFVLTPQINVLVEEIVYILDSNNHSASEEIFVQRNVFQNWKLKLLFKSGESGIFVKHFVAQVLYVSIDMSISPVTLLQMIENSLHQPWRIELPGKKYDLNVTLDLNYWYLPRIHEENGSAKILYAPTWLIYWVHYVSNRQIEKYQLLSKVIDSVGDLSEGGIVISKLFFCEQVELLPDEYVVEGSNIFLLKKGKYLQKGVYTMFGTDPVYRVCLSDFQGQKSSSFRQKIGLFYLKLFLFFYILGRH